MNETIKILSENLGIETVISAVIVCVIMALIKKRKPKISPRQEIIIRLLISIGVHLLFTLVTKGEYAQIFQNSTSVCGVSLIICAIISKNENKTEVEKVISTFLPEISDEDCKEIVNALSDGEKATVNAPPSVYHSVENSNGRESASD